MLAPFVTPPWSRLYNAGMPTATTSEVDATATSDVCALATYRMCTQGIPVAAAQEGADPTAGALTP